VPASSETNGLEAPYGTNAKLSFYLHFAPQVFKLSFKLVHFPDTASLLNVLTKVNCFLVAGGLLLVHANFLEKVLAHDFGNGKVNNFCKASVHF